MQEQKTNGPNAIKSLPITFQNFEEVLVPLKSETSLRQSQ